MTKNTKKQRAQQVAIKAYPTKAEMIVSMLKRKTGASLTELAEATGWQTHSVRGFMSGTLKKKLGLEIKSTKADNKDRRYRIEVGAQ